MNPFEETIGASVTCAKTVGESDVYLFAGITGDLSPNHVDEVAMAGDKCEALMRGHYPVSLGYDRVRFLEAVKIGDTITITYRIVNADAERMRTVADVNLHNQNGTLCAVASHIMRWLRRPD